MNSIPQKVREQIPELRSRHGSLYLLDVTEFRTDELTSCVVLRPLTRREFNSFTEDYTLDPVGSTVRMVEQGVVAAQHPLRTISFESECHWIAGLDEHIVTAVSKISGFASEDMLVEAIEASRQEAQSLESIITAFICKAFPYYDPFEVDNMTFEQQMKIAALAEVLLGKPVPYEEFFGEGKPQEQVQKQGHVTREQVMHQIPVPDGMMSHGAAPPTQRNPNLNVPPAQPDRHVTVTPENLFDTMRETADVFSGGPQ